jgi:hypothetical protein
MCKLTRVCLVLFAVALLIPATGCSRKHCKDTYDDTRYRDDDCNR